MPTMRTTMRMSARRFMAEAERRFAVANPDARDVVIRWIDIPRLVRYPTGRSGWWGRFEVSAPGYRPRLLWADCWADGTGWTVR